MTHIDNSKIFVEGVFADASVLVPQNTIYREGTVLGRNAEGALTAYTSDVATSTPLYILAVNIANEGESPVTLDNVRVFDSGVVDKNKLIFIKESDGEDVKVLDALKVNNFRLVPVEELTIPSNLAE